MTAQEFRASFAEDFRRELADLTGATVPSDDRCVVRFDDNGKLNIEMRSRRDREADTTLGSKAARLFPRHYARTCAMRS